DARVKVWQNHIANYEAMHPALDANTITLLDTISALITPDLVSAPTAIERLQVKGLIGDVRARHGQDDTSYLFERLGPKDDGVSVAERVSERLANYVRSAMVAFADAATCDCNVDWGCSGYSTSCSSNGGCPPDTSWPMCGLFWNDPCNGTCQTG